MTSVKAKVRIFFFAKKKQKTLVRLLLPLWSVLPIAAHAAPPPASAYAELPTAASARMSPDGNSVAYIDGQGNSNSVVVAEIDGNKLLPMPTGDWTPNWIRWKDNQTLLVSTRTTATSDGGTPYPIGQLMALAADGSKSAPLQFLRTDEDPAASVAAGNRSSVANLSDRVVSDLPGQQGQILVQVGDIAYDYPTVYDVDLWDASRHVAERLEPGVAAWAADPDGVVRAGYFRSETSQPGVFDTHIVARTSQSDAWHILPFQADVLAFSATDPTILYALLAPDNAPASVVQFDIPSGTIKNTFTAAPKGRLALITNNGVMVGYAVDTDSGWNRTYIDPTRAAIATTIAHALNVADVELIDLSTDGTRITALAAKPGQPAELCLLDRAQTPDALNPLLTDYEDVPAGQIATGTWTNFKAREGLDIPLLITLPVNAPKTPIPFVVLPHGGPSAHDTGEFDWLVQFLVSRGYGVLQPQFRGSTGYGSDFENRGKQQWGRAMQDDVTDASKWLIGQNLADPKRICIVGAGYGGYAALEGAEKEPSLYACAAAIAPVTDLPAFLDDQHFFAFSDENLPAIGDDPGTLAAVSPDRHADQIQIPVLLIQGDKDFNVSAEQTKKMEAALKFAGKVEQTLYLPNADGDFSHPADRLAILNALETFLAHSLGGT